jgi:hypothetical protein
MRLLEKGNLKPFFWYCLIVGILITLYTQVTEGSCKTEGSSNFRFLLNRFSMNPQFVTTSTRFQTHLTQRIDHGLFESVENQMAENGLYFIQYYPFCAIRFINSFQTIHDLSFLRKISSKFRWQKRDYFP